jgi:hypothetical protein
MFIGKAIAQLKRCIGRYVVVIGWPGPARLDKQWVINAAQSQVGLSYNRPDGLSLTNRSYQTILILR